MAIRRDSRLGIAVIISGLLALVGFALLAAALAAPLPASGTLRRSEALFLWQDGGVLLQALAMFPVILGLASWLPGRPSATRSPLMLFGLFAHVALVSVLLIRFANLTSDTVYMIPQGLVGAWLLLAGIGMLRGAREAD